MVLVELVLLIEELCLTECQPDQDTVSSIQKLQD